MNANPLQRDCFACKEWLGAALLRCRVSAWRETCQALHSTQQGLLLVVDSKPSSPKALRNPWFILWDG